MTTTLPRFIAAVLIILAALPALAQDGLTPRELEARGLMAQPVVNESIGLEIHPPQNSQVIPSQAGAQVTVEMRDAAAVPTWSVEFVPLMTSIPNPTADSVAQMFLDQLDAAEIPKTILRDERIAIHNKPSRLIYFRDAGETSVGLIAGVLIVPTGGQRFLLGRIGIGRSHFEIAEPLLDSSFRTMKVFSETEVRMIQQKRLENAEALLAKLTPERLRSLDGYQQWYRLYRPDAQGETLRDREIGYVLVQVSEGPRGLLTPERSPEAYQTDEQEVGLILKVNARVLLSDDGKTFADQQSIFWLSFDRAREAWSIRITTRQGEQSITEGETGIRVPPAPGRPYSRINVITQQRESMSRDEVVFVVPDEPFLSQLEVFMLGHLLPRDGSLTGEMAFRYYEPSLRDQKVLASRVDTWRPTSDQSGRWMLESELLAGTPPVISFFNANGELIRREKPDGSVTAPVKIDELQRIWRSKGLPTR